MKKTIVLLPLLCLTVAAWAQERIEPIPFGHLDQWAVRYIKESKILGGKTKTLYAVAPTDTLRMNAPFEYGRHGNPWSVSSAYARVSGIDKASGTVSPERRGKGFCARLDSRLDTVSALGIVDLKVIVAGSLFTGKTIEPVTNKGTSDPYSIIDMGVPFTKHPVALMLDFKSYVENSNVITYAKATSKPKNKEGHDCPQMTILLQHRWEDADGNIYARRVGTGCVRIDRTYTEWQNDFRIPIRWGDITQQPGFQDYEGLNVSAFKATNKQGKMVPINETGYGLENPTHVIIMLSSGHYEAFVGHAGNTLWVDNIRWVYDE